MINFLTGLALVGAAVTASFALEIALVGKYALWYNTH